MFLTSLKVKLGNYEKEFIKSIDSIFDGYLLLSKENTVLSYRIKDKLLNLYFGSESLQKRNLKSVGVQIQQESMKELIRKILEKKPQLFELKLKVSDQIGYYNIFIFILANDQMLINFQNIDKLKKIEFELAEERNTLKNIIELNPYAIEIKDIEGRHVSANKAFIDMFKSVPPPEYSLFEDPHLKKIGVLDRILTLKEGKVLRMGEHWYDPRDSATESNLNLDEIPSSLICHKAVSFPIFDTEGNIKNYVFMHEDITERKQAEIELEGLRKDLEIRIKERTIKLESSELKYRKAYSRADCYKGLFTHDISNMFHTIGNSIELCEMLLKEGIKNNDILEYFEVIEQQIKRGKKLINNIRNLSEIEESEMPLEPTEIFEKLRSAIQFVRVNFQKREIIVNLEPETNKICVFANDLLLDVFENILTNSVLYNKNDTIEIKIKISRIKENGKTYIKLEFKDNGVGINDTKKKPIFKKNDKKTIGSKGMGLGLSLVAKLLELCEGKIWVEDRIKGDYTQGSNFIIQIPEAVY